MIEHWLSRFRLGRKLLGGRWELWWIDVCHKALWLRINNVEPDDRYQPCSVGPRMAREDYPERSNSGKVAA